jgi:hypothetical protein
MELGHLLTRSGLTYPEVSSKSDKIPSASWGIMYHYPVLTNEEMATESQRYNRFTRNGENAIPKHAGPEAKGSNPTTGLTLLWARNPFRGNFNHWQVSTNCI